jgi:uncharacterized protein (DUF1501 family)
MRDATSRGCDDWHVSRRRLLERSAGHVLELPEQALVEGPGAAAATLAGAGLTRRRLLAAAGGLTIACAAAPKFGARGLLEAAAAEAADAPDARILVSLYLDGGNDGLNTLVPTADARYRQLRARIGINPAATLAVPGHPEFGWHPSLGGLKQLYDAGKVAVLPAVDYANPDQSHFNSQIFWRTGVVGPTPDRTGWLGRTIEASGGSDNALQAVSIGTSLDPILLTRRAPVATILDPGTFGFAIPGVPPRRDGPALRPYRGALHGARSPAHKAAQQAYRDAIGMFDRLGGLRAEGANVPPPPVAYPDEPLGRGLRSLARILGAGFGTRIATISQSGYDTHDAQREEHAQLLATLSGSLVAWQADLDARGLADRVLTVVWSEFGRRCQDNDAFGSDHGAGGCVLVVGNHANGGIRSEFPGLASLDEDGNLKVTTEFRTLYATLLESWLGVEAARVLPGVGPQRLALVK